MFLKFYVTYEPPKVKTEKPRESCTFILSLRTRVVVVEKHDWE